MYEPFCLLTAVSHILDNINNVRYSVKIMASLNAITLIKILHACVVQHLSLPSNILDPEQLRDITHHMGCLQTLEMCNIVIMIHTGKLRKLTIYLNVHSIINFEELFKHWIESELRLSS